jgi:phosphatidylinositol 4-kinase A
MPSTQPSADHLTKPLQSSARVHCHIAFAELAQNLPSGHLESAIPVLLDMLRDFPYIDFDSSLNWSGECHLACWFSFSIHFLDWALPDQLVYATVTGLLRLAEKSTENREGIVAAIVKLSSEIVSQMQSKSSRFLLYSCFCDPGLTAFVAVAIITQVYPALHGLYRALVSIPFNWTITNWHELSKVVSVLLEADTIDRLNDLVINVVQLEDAGAHLPQTVLARYVSKDRPLSGYFAVCCIMEIQWTVLAQTLFSSPEGGAIDYNEDAAAANAAWNVLVAKKVVILEQYSPPVIEGLKQTLSRAMECFTDLLAQMGELEGEPSLDTYAWETMAECLVRSDIW